MSVEDDFVVVEYLKMHFGTILLNSYDFPDIDNVKAIIDEEFESSDVVYASPVLALRRLLKMFVDEEDDMLKLVDNDFLDTFHQHVQLFKGKSFPHNMKNSLLTFFEKFFAADFLPRDNSTQLEIVEWCKFVVQFKESDKERVEHAIMFAKHVKNYIDMQYMKKLDAIREEVMKDLENKSEPMKKETEKIAEPILTDCCADVEMNTASGTSGVNVVFGDDEKTKVFANDKMKPFSSAWNTALNDIFVDYDTKFCGCYEYENSMNCGCLYDTC